MKTQVLTFKINTSIVHGILKPFNILDLTQKNIFLG